VLHWAALRKLSVGFGDGAVEAVGMLAAGEVDGHFARGTGQLAASGAGLFAKSERRAGLLGWSYAAHW
jgi:hypothetical protein